MRRAVPAAAVLAAAAVVFVAVAAQGKARPPAQGEATGSLAQAEAGSPAHGQGQPLGHGKAVTARHTKARAPAHRATAALAHGEAVAAGNIRDFLLDLDGHDYNWASVAPGYRGIALNSWDSAWRAQIRAASPGTKVYVYKSLIDTRSNDCGTNSGGGSSCIVGGKFCPAGVNDAPQLADGMGFCWAWRNHPNWFLHTSSGSLIRLAGYPDTYMMDFGQKAYQQTWLHNVLTSTKAGGFQGVFADNAIITTGYGVSAKYPTNAAVQSAMASMLATVGPGLRSHGIKLLANLGNNNVYPSIWGKWLRYVSGFLNEFWGYWPGNKPQSGWAEWITAEVRQCVAQHKVCEFHAGDRSIPLTRAQQNYVTATLLLFTDGRQYLAYAGDSPPSPQTRLGAPRSSALRSNGDSWRRVFACGVVTVNPAGDGAQGTGTVTNTC
jgi:hypothetical protein